MRTIIAGRWVYGLLAAVCFCNLTVLALTRAELDLTRWPALVGPIAVIASLTFASGCYLRTNPRSPRLLTLTDTTLQALLFLKLAWLNIRLFNHLTMTAALPYVDGTLVEWDEALGFDWLAYFQWVHDRPWAIEVLERAYISLTPVSVFALLGLMAMGQPLRARYFLETFFVTAVAATALGWLVPAEAAVVMLAGDFQAWPNFAETPGLYHMPHLEALRAPKGPIVIDPLNMPGLVTIPSFHTAAGIVIAVAYWRTRAALPVLAYVVVMIASTPIYGAHYIVDLIAGTALALVVAAIVVRHPRYRCLLRPDAPRPVMAD